MYIDQGMSRSMIAAQFGVSDCAVYLLFSKLGIKFRSIHKANKLRYSRKEMHLTEQQEQLIYGSLLGDACLFRQKKVSSAGRVHFTYKLLFAHGRNQLPYLRHKHSVLSCSKIGQRPEGSNLGLPVFQTAFSNSKLLKDVARVCHDRGHKKRVSAAWVSRVNVQGVAYWYQDDGCLSKTGVDRWRLTFHTNSFSKRELALLAGKLATFGLGVIISRASYKVTNQFVLTCYNVHQIKQFLQQLAPYVVPCLQYKLRCLPLYAKAVKLPYSEPS